MQHMRHTLIALLTALAFPVQASAEGKLPSSLELAQTTVITDGYGDRLAFTPGGLLAAAAGACLLAGLLPVRRAARQLWQRGL